MNISKPEGYSDVFERKSLNKEAKNILIVGVFHGEEPQGDYIIHRYLQQSNFKEIKNNLYFIPCLNQFGKMVNKRGNKNGVDLNRNFPTKNWKKTEKDDYFSGDTPASEPETKFILETIKKIKPDIILSIHAPLKLVNYDGPANELAEKISELCGYPVKEYIGYPTPGSFGTYFGVERNIPTITLELDDEETNDSLYQRTKPVIEYLEKSA